MSDRVFVDTNVLLYWRDDSEPGKQQVAAERLQKLWRGRNGRLSIQVLNEYFVNVTRKLVPGLPAEEAWSDVEDLIAWHPVEIDTPLLARTYAFSQRYQLSWWDSMIVAAAERSDCAVILSEDLSPSQDYFGIRVENPFL